MLVCRVVSPSRARNGVRGSHGSWREDFAGPRRRQSRGDRISSGRRGAAAKSTREYPRLQAWGLTASHLGLGPCVSQPPRTWPGRTLAGIILGARGLDVRRAT